MEIKKSKVNFNKSASGSMSARLILPAQWARDMGITAESNDIILELIDNKIIISKGEKE